MAASLDQAQPRLVEVVEGKQQRQREAVQLQQTQQQLQQLQLEQLDAGRGDGGGGAQSAPGAGGLAHSREREQTAYAFLVLILFLQFALLALRAKFPQRFNEATLLLLWLFPLLQVWRDTNWMSALFLAAWAAWSARTLSLVRLAMRKPLDKLTPQRVYKWFLGTHTVCYVAGMSAIYACLLLPLPALLVLFYALYFAVLGRDFAEICTTRISSTIGYTSHASPPPNLCALCGDELRPVLAIMSGEVQEHEAQEGVRKLGCGHEFHLTCISGWCLVGKKHSCPYCNEKVDLKSVIPESPWNSKNVSLLWLNLLTLLRFLLGTSAGGRCWLACCQGQAGWL
jgi:RING finger protein 121